MTQVAHPLGRRIQKWRTRAGLSAEDVAKSAGVPISVFQAVEAGNDELTAYKFHRVAQALGVDPAALLGKAPNSDPLRSTARFRTSAEGLELDPQDVRLLSIAAEVGRVGASLCELFGDDRLAGLPRKNVAMKDKPWKQGYQLGERAREVLAADRKALKSVQATFEALGVHVALVAFATSNVDAASLREPGAMPVILLNTRSVRVQRFRPRRAVLAHELCHLLHDASDDHVVTVVSRATDLHVDLEMRANGFAPAFLAPPSWLNREQEPIALARELVGSWAFSIEGAAWHVRNVLGLTEAEGASLAMQLQSAGVVERPIAEPVEHEDLIASPLVHGLVGELARRAAAKHHISEARANEIAAIG